jgi:hypothetical protein
MNERKVSDDKKTTWVVLSSLLFFCCWSMIKRRKKNDSYTLVRSIFKNRRVRMLVKPISFFFSLLLLLVTVFFLRSIESTECLPGWLTNDDRQRSSFSLPDSTIADGRNYYYYYFSSFSHADGESIYLIYIIENLPACTYTTLNLLMGLNYKE